MNIYEKIRRFIEDKAKLWYLVVAILITLEIANLFFLGLIIPKWVCGLISIALLAIGTFYIAILFTYVKTKYSNFMKVRRDELFERIDNLQLHIDELDEKNTELENKLAENLHQAVLERVNEVNTSISDMVTSFDKKISLKIDQDYDDLKKHVTHYADEQEKRENDNRCVIENTVTLTENKLIQKIDIINQDQIGRADKFEEHLSNQDNYMEGSFTNIVQQVFNTNEENNARSSEIKTLIQMQTEVAQSSDSANLKAFEEVNGVLAGIRKNAEELIVGSKEEILSSVKTNVEALEEHAQQDIMNMINQLKDTTITGNQEIISGNTESNRVLKQAIENINGNLERSKEDNLKKLESLESKISTAVQGTIDECNEIEKRLVTSLTSQDRNTELKINEVKTDLESLFGKVSTEINDIKTEAINESVAKLEEVEKQITELKQKQIDFGELQSSQFEKMLQQLQELDNGWSDRTQELENKAVTLQAEISKLLGQVLDAQDEDSDIAKRVTDRLVTQVENLVVSTKKEFETLSERIDLGSKTVNAIKQSTEQFVGDHQEQSRDIREKIDHNILVVEENQKEIFARINNLQGQIVNLTSLTEIIKKVSEQTRPGENSGSEPQRKEPNRTEEIKDSENGVTIYNNYKNNALVSSEMRKGKQISYKVEYDAQGMPTRSMNYDSKGNVVTELQFYPNGQIKTRTEKMTVDGNSKTVVAKFDERGNKLN